MMLLLLLFLLCGTVVSQSIVENLPGFPGPLPFKLETGYIGVDEDDDVQLFYYFIESEREPAKDPLLLWLTGGPGCSGFSGLVYEIGPVKYNAEASEGQLPSFDLNPYSWTKVANIIFLDSPAGAGFSYTTASESYHPSDTRVAESVYLFLRKWLLNHPKFIKNSLYITGDSYAGIWIPMVVWKISEGNEAGYEPYMKLEGYTAGNPVTDHYIDGNSRLPFAHRLGLLSDKYYKMAKIHCKGNYVNQTNPSCVGALKHYTDCVSKIYVYHVLEPTCQASLVRQEELGFAKPMGIRLPSESEPEPEPEALCTREKIYLYCRIWANDPTVQEALHVRQGTVQQWKRCAGKQLQFDRDVSAVVGYHQLLSNKGYRVLVYSGDHDLSIPYLGTMAWIRKLSLSIDDDWRPWFVDDEVAGYTMKYKSKKNQQYNLTFATVKGGGHTAPEYRPKECLAMLERFLSNDSL